MHRTDVTYNINEEFELEGIANEYRYKAVSYHRNGTSGKSQWRITVDEEIELFVDAIKEENIIGNNGWMLLVRNGQRKIVGITTNHEESYVGRFRKSTDVEWHGYPGDYRCDVSDIPPYKVLRKWVDSCYMNKSDMSRIQTQKPCNL